MKIIQVATVEVTTGRVAAAATQIDQSYSPDGDNIIRTQPHLIHGFLANTSPCSNRLAWGLAIFAGSIRVPNAQTDRKNRDISATELPCDIGSNRSHAMRPIVKLKVKVKFSHTRYRALGPELIPVYRQSARR